MCVKVLNFFSTRTCFSKYNLLLKKILNVNNIYIYLTFSLESRIVRYRRIGDIFHFEKQQCIYIINYINSTNKSVICTRFAYTIGKFRFGDFGQRNLFIYKFLMYRRRSSLFFFHTICMHCVYIISYSQSCEYIFENPNALYYT